MKFFILLIEGYKENLDLLREILERQLGHLVETAANAHQAQIQLRTAPFDIIMANETTAGVPGLLCKLKGGDQVLKTVLITDDPWATKPLCLDALLRYPPPEGTTMEQAVEQVIELISWR